MLEAKLDQAVVLKRLIDAVKELVTDANFECNEDGVHLQAMDNSHVALVSVKMKADGFTKYRCDRPMPLGVNLNSLTKVLKCAKDDDSCVLKATDDGDILSLTYEAKNSDRIAEYDMKLMDIDADQLGIPDTEYDAAVTMHSSEFGRIVRDLSMLGESVKIEVSKEGVRFVADGESANGSVLLKQTESARRRWENYGKEDEKEPEEDADEEAAEEGAENAENEDGDEEEGSSKKSPKKAKANGVKVKREKDADVDMEDVEEDDGGEFKARSDDEDGEEEADDGDDDEGVGKKRKRAATNGKKVAKKSRTSTSASASTSKRKAKKSGDEDEGDSGGVRIEMNQHVSLTFSLKYLVNFAKSASLSDTVQVMMSADVPLLVSYKFGQGHIQYYLAPKIGDD